MNALIQPLILLVEDDPSLRELLAQNLQFEGYRILLAHTGKEGLRLAQSESVDLILLDLMLPQMSGIELCKQLRARGDKVPIIMLTAKGEIHDKVRGLKLRADDYITKPFDLLELLARIEAALRRGGSVQQFQSRYHWGDTTFEVDQYTLHKGSETLSLTQQESLLLRYLVHHEGKVLPREQIFEDVWGHEELYSLRTIDTHVTKLRQKIEPIPGKPRHILTVHGVGYKFVK